jgi:hypothetical protein
MLNSNDAFVQYCEEQGLDPLVHLSAIREEIGNVLNKEITTDTDINGRIVFYANRDNGSKKAISFSPLMQKRIKLALQKRTEMERLKNDLNQGDVFLIGTICKIEKYGVKVTTQYGEAIFPFREMIPSEKSLYKVGVKLNFRIKKISKKIPILERKSEKLVIHTIAGLLKDEITVFDVKRMFGRQLKIFANRMPSSFGLEKLRMMYPKEVIKISIKS